MSVCKCKYACSRVCMAIYVYVCMCVYMIVSLCTYNVDVCTCVYVYACIYVLINVFTVIVCNNLSPRDPHRQVGVDSVRTWCNVADLHWPGVAVTHKPLEIANSPYILIVEVQVPGTSSRHKVC